VVVPGCSGKTGIRNTRSEFPPMQKMQCSLEGGEIDYPIHMRKIQRPGKPRRKIEPGWKWRKNYRVWDANPRIFLYPENWIEPELRLPARFRVPLSELALFLCPGCGSERGSLLFPRQEWS